jgi:hypothetical protein
VVGALVVVAFTVPGTVYYLKRLHDEAPQHFLAAGEARALRFLAALHAPGGVLAREPLGSAVPAFAGRRSWVGHPSWTPDWPGRAALADRLFAARLDATAARALVQGSGARFLLADCGSRVDMRRLLGSLISGTQRFGCAVVYRVG